MLTQTAERWELQREIDALLDDRVVITLDFIRELRNETPGAETRAAITELRAGKGETTTIAQIMAELNAGD